MPIILTNPFVPAVPHYDKVHLDHLTITLEKTDYARVAIQARVRMYHQVENGTKVFSPETREIQIPDTERWIVQLVGRGDIRGVQAGEHIKAVVALLVETETNLGSTTVV